MRLLAPGSEVLLIEDTGIGIAPEDLPRIFEQGYTGYNGRQDKKSTGIGLYLCQKIAGQLLPQAFRILLFRGRAPGISGFQSLFQFQSYRNVRLKLFCKRNPWQWAEKIDDSSTFATVPKDSK